MNGTVIHINFFSIIQVPSSQLEINKKQEKSLPHLLTYSKICHPFRENSIQILSILMRKNN